MNLFIKRIIIFTTVAFIAATTLQLFVSFKIKDDNIFGTDNLDTTDNLDADLILMGSSRAWAHFDPAFFDSAHNLKTVNIGMNGHSEFPIILLRLQNYLSKNKPPKYAILNFDPFSKAGSLNSEKNFIMKNEYARYMFFPSQENLELLDYFEYDLAEKYVPLYALFKYRILFKCLFQSENIYQKTGYWPNDEQWDTIRNPVVDVMKKNIYTDAQTSEVSKSLKEIDDFCRKSGIKLLCLQSPVYKIIHDEKSFSRTGEICRTLGIPYINANIPEIRNNIEYFYNSTHLNKKGVRRMNEFLRNDKTLENFFTEKEDLKP